MSVPGVVLELRRKALMGQDMTTAEFVAPARPGLRGWIASHGLAAAIIACAIFWSALGIALYLAL